MLPSHHQRSRSACTLLGPLVLQLLTWQLPWADVPTYTVTHIVINGGRPEVPPWQQLPGPDTAKFVGLSSYVRLMRSVAARWGLGGSQSGLASVMCRHGPAACVAVARRATSRRGCAFVQKT